MQSIQPDHVIVTSEGSVGVGAVRRVHADRIDAFIENFGEVTLRAEHVAAVHDGKVVLALDALPEDLRRAVAQAHAREDPDYVHGATPDDGSVSEPDGGPRS